MLEVCFPPLLPTLADCLRCKLHSPLFLRLHNGLSAWYVAELSSFTAYPEVSQTVSEAGKGIYSFICKHGFSVLLNVGCWHWQLPSVLLLQWHRVWAMDLPSTQKWRAYWTVLGPTPSLQRPGIPLFPACKPPVHVVNCLQSWNCWDRNWILFTDEVLLRLVAFCLFLPPTWPQEGSSSVYLLKWRSFLKPVLGLQIPWCSLVVSWLLVEKSQECSTLLVFGNWILWMYGRVMWQSNSSSSHSLSMLFWHRLQAAEHQVTLTDQKAAGLAVLKAFYVVGALSGQSAWWPIVWWSWLVEQYMWVKVPQGPSAIEGIQREFLTRLFL